MWKALLEIIFPPVCLLCAKRSREKGFCGECRAMLDKKRITSPVCLRCGAPFHSPKAVGHVCGQCLKTPPHFNAARSAFVYDGHVLDAVHRFKYAGDTSLARPLAMEALGALGSKDHCLIVPVPLHPERLRARGFNQSVLIARELARITSIELCCGNLKRARNTGQQVGLGVEERKKNVAGAFRLENPALLKGKKTLLVDDVMTTGATINECARLLKGSGAEVFALTVARAIKV